TPTPNFATWLNSRYETQAANYRMALQTVISTALQWARGSNWEQKHTDACIEVMRSIPIEPLGKYPGEATQEDKAYFATAHKPNFKNILNDYIKLLPSVSGA